MTIEAALILGVSFCIGCRLLQLGLRRILIAPSNNISGVELTIESNIGDFFEDVIDTMHKRQMPKDVN